MADTVPTSRTIRVALAGFAGLGDASVRGCLSGHADIAIVTECAGPDMLGDLTAEVDVVVARRAGDGIPDPFRRQLFAQGGVPIIAIADDGRLEIYDKRVLRQVAVDELLAEVRRVAALTRATR
ncbi:MAG TPA: hypothetical protein VEA99_20305 [Gemmatimonadaceae bacterium]|nr:hypothetical protein [Gemmatimonadaceae bacterium]